MRTAAALAAFSESRVVNQLKSAALLMPVAYLAHINTPIGILLSKAFVGEVLLDFLGMAEIDPLAPLVTNLIRAFCRCPSMSCYDLAGSITGKNYCLNSSVVDFFLKYEPEPTSTVHFAQTVRDVLLERNIASYGQGEPPVYRISGIPPSSASPSWRPISCSW